MFGYLGIGNGQIRGLFRNQTLIRCLIAFLISCVELVLIENVLTLALNKTLHVTNFTFSITLWPILVVFACSTIVPLLITQVILLVLSKRKSVE